MNTAPARAAGRRLGSRGYRAVVAREPRLTDLGRRARRAALLARLKWAADAVGGTVEAEIAADVEIGRRVRVSVWPGSHNQLRLAGGVRIGDDVTFLLKGARIDIGDRVDIRHRCVLNVAGHLEMTADNILSWGGVIHCAEHIRWEPMAAASEYVTVTDSSHFFTEPSEFFYHNTRTQPVVIGANTWLCTRVVVASGAAIGDHCIVGANSVVTGIVPPWRLVSGVPAEVVRELSPRPAHAPR